MRFPLPAYAFLKLSFPRQPTPAISSLHAAFPALLLFLRFKSCSNALKNLEEIPNSLCRSNRSSKSGKSMKSCSSKERLRKYSGMLKDFVLMGSRGEGKALHGYLIRRKIELDSHLWVSLINFYVKSGFLDYAVKVLDEMPERDVVSWTTLISGFVAEGYAKDGVRFLSDMRREGIKPNEFTLATCLKACSMCLDMKCGQQIKAIAIKLGLFLDLFVGSALVDLYAKCREMELAKKVFFGMSELNIVSWTALLNGYAEMGDGDEVLKLFITMKESEMRFGEFTLSAVLKGCANSRSTIEGKSIHCMAIKIGCEFFEVLSCSLVDMYSRCGLANDALRVFNRITNPDLVTWSSIIACLDQQARYEEAASLFNVMRQTGVVPNEFTYASVVSTATDLNDFRYAESIHAAVLKNGFEYDNLVGNALVTMYMQYGCVRDGVALFEAMINKDSISWNALLSGFHDNDHEPRILHQMLKEGFELTVCTCIDVLSSCSSFRSIGFGKQLHTHMVKKCLDGNELVQTALIDMYAKSGYLKDAIFGFNTMIQRDVFAWTVMINGYARTDKVEEMVKWFNHMVREGLNPNEFTLTNCLSRCTDTGSLEIGRLFHALAVKAGYLDDVFVSSALVDLYGKCGCIEDAEAMFEGLLLVDTVSWNTMMFLYLRYGLRGKALQGFQMMLKEGFVSDEVTLKAVGYAYNCVHVTS